MKKGMWGLGMVLVLLAGGVEAGLFLPPAGEDKFPATKAILGVNIGEQTMEIGCSGPTRIMRGDPMGNTIQTEMLSLDLACSGGMMVHLNPGQRSMGQIQSTGDSFFDVFVEIDVPGMGTLMNKQAVRVQARISHIPPIGSVYFGVQPVPLVDQSNQVVGVLVHVEHDTNGTPKPETSGEVSPVFSCFYECKLSRRTSSWLELTTLMLVNQSAKQPLTAEILFVDGHQKPIARTSTNLSPEDLDEMNVCETLDKGGIAVPPAGVIEVVLSAGATGVPVGGAYGWVKNLIGTFTRSVPEPFEGRVTGIAKTECRLVGPNVVTPSEIRAKSAPNIQPILIEGTAE